MSELGGCAGGQEAWTHCEADAHGGGEGPCDELALVELNQQRGLAHSAVPHEDGLQRESHTQRGCIMQASVPQHHLSPEAWGSVHVHLSLSVELCAP